MTSNADTRTLYLDLIQECLLNTIYEDPAQDPWSGRVFDPVKRERGLDWPSVAHTMIGRMRMANLRKAVEFVIEHDIPGDLIETGAWRGGACIYMRAILKAYGITNRRVFVCDSFEGLPRPDASRYPADAGDMHHTFTPLAVSLEEVRSNFARYGLLDDQVVFLKGWFKDTLPTAPIDRIAVLRLDGDMYESTMDGIANLYHKVSQGGMVIVDDFGAVRACASAIFDYRHQEGITDRIFNIDHMGVFWQKEEKAWNAARNGAADSDPVMTMLRNAGMDTRTVAEPVRPEGVQASAKPGLTSIVILTHNQLEDTKICLNSLRQSTPEPHELILVDNASTDGTVPYLRDYAATFDNVRLIENDTNRGFAAGNNQGIAIARGEQVVLLNNDTAVPPGWLAAMLDVLRRMPEVGLVGPMSNCVGGPQLVESPKYSTLEEMTTFAKRWSRAHRGQTTTTPRLVGFCLLARKAVIDRIGGLDEGFGLGNFEDDDFCVRAIIAGYQACIAQDAYVHHTGSRTFLGQQIDHEALMRRNWEIYKAKWGIPAATALGRPYEIKIGPEQEAKLVCALPSLAATHRWEEAGRRWVEQAGTHWLAAPAWGDGSWQAVVRRYVEAAPAEGNTLLLYAGDSAAVDINAAYDRVLGLLDEMNVAPEKCPDIEIIDTLEHHPQAVAVLSGSTLDDRLRAHFGDRCVPLSDWVAA